MLRDRPRQCAGPTARPARIARRPSVIKNGRDDTQPHRQRYECHACRRRFDDLTGTIFADHRQPLKTWITCLYLMGLNLSGLQIAKELNINKDDARAMIQQLRQGIVNRRPAPPSPARSNATKSMWWLGIRAIPRPSKKTTAKNGARTERGRFVSLLPSIQENMEAHFRTTRRSIKMPHRWPADTDYIVWDLDVLDRDCAFCGRMMHICDHRNRRFFTLEGPVKLVCKLNHCPDPDCPGHAKTKSPEMEASIALPAWAIGWDVFCWIGHRRFSRHWSIPQISLELVDTYDIKLSEPCIGLYIQRYQTMLAARSRTSRPCAGNMKELMTSS